MESSSIRDPQYHNSAYSLRHEGARGRAPLQSPAGPAGGSRAHVNLLPGSLLFIAG